MVVLRVTFSIFMVLIVFTSTILTALMIYLFLRLINRRKRKFGPQQGLEPGLLDTESGREPRLSHQLSRQQTQQELREDLLQRFSLVPPSPSIKLLPEINTRCSDDRASEWLERGVTDNGVDVVDGDLRIKKPEMRQIAVVKPRKYLRWECGDGGMMDGRSGGVEKAKDDGVSCTQHRLEKSSDIPA